MEFKRSAGIFVGGITLLVGGPLLAYVGNLFMEWAALRNDGDLMGAFIGVSVLGGVLGVAGFLMVVVAAHRALVKIDALPVRVPNAARREWSATP